MSRRSGGQDGFAGVSARGNTALLSGPAAPGWGGSLENFFAVGSIVALVVGGANIRYSYIPRLQTVTIPTLVITEDVANELLAPSGKRLADVQAAVRARRSDPAAPAAGFDLPTTIRMSVSLTPVHDVDAINVVGLLRAGNADSAKRAVLVGGHLDGVGTDPDGSVFQAANDNASGPAGTIEGAPTLPAARSSLTHSLLFLALGRGG